MSFDSSRAALRARVPAALLFFVTCASALASNKAYCALICSTTFFMVLKIFKFVNVSLSQSYIIFHINKLFFNYFLIFGAFFGSLCPEFGQSLLPHPQQPSRCFVRMCRRVRQTAAAAAAATHIHTAVCCQSIIESYYLLSIIYYLLSIIYYLFSLIYSLIQNSSAKR